jgi:hypothetical protein
MIPQSKPRFTFADLETVSIVRENGMIAPKITNILVSVCGHVDPVFGIAISSGKVVSPSAEYSLFEIQ